MDITRRERDAIRDFEATLRELKGRVDDHSGPAVVRGRHAELGWVVFVKDGHSAVLISEHAFVDFIDEG